MCVFRPCCWFAVTWGAAELSESGLAVEMTTATTATAAHFDENTKPAEIVRFSRFLRRTDFPIGQVRAGELFLTVPSEID